MLRQLKYFQAVVKYNSFSEAAAMCNISQSAISQQIKALEQELNVELLERKNRKFVLTPQGEYFYKKSLVLVADFEQICRETNRIANKDNDTLKIGFLRCYVGEEFQLALEEFATRYKDVSIQIEYGNHEELYYMLRDGLIDIAFNDQRRMFSGEYVNILLNTAISYIEVSSRSILSELEKITVKELKNIPCILIASDSQKETEQEYYGTIIGFQGEKLFADNIEAGRLMVISGKGFLVTEGTPIEGSLGTNIKRIPLYRGNEPITKNYCAFFKKESKNNFAKEFAELLKEKFKKKD